MGQRRGLYGVDLSREPFRGLAAEAQVELLLGWGVNAVFGPHQDAAFACAARLAGIALHVEFGCFAGARWWTRFPDCKPITPRGVILQPEDGYHGVNPAHGGIRQQRLRDLEDLLRSHRLDGVWLDFLRWPCHWEVPRPRLVPTAFDADTIAQFARDRLLSLSVSGPQEAADLLLTRYREEWLAWRREQVLSWVAEARQIVDRVQPGVELGLFAVPWQRGEYADAIWDVVAQDHAGLATFVDAFSPMVYHAMCGRSAAWIAEVAAYFAGLTGKAVWPIIQSVDYPRPLDVPEYTRALSAALNSPSSDGVLVFTAQPLARPAMRAATRSRFLA